MFEIRPWNFQASSDYSFAQWNVRPRLEWPLIEFGGKTITNLRYYSNIIFNNGFYKSTNFFRFIAICYLKQESKVKPVYMTTNKFIFLSNTNTY
jgi:hypothetical protein